MFRTVKGPPRDAVTSAIANNASSVAATAVASLTSQIQSEESELPMASARNPKVVKTSSSVSTKASSGVAPSTFVLDRHALFDLHMCPKKFFNLHALPLLHPQPLSSSKAAPLPAMKMAELVRMQDALEFRNLCFTWDRQLRSSSAVLIKESEADQQASQRTIDVVNAYFSKASPSPQRGASPLLLHRPMLKCTVPIVITKADLSVGTQKNAKEVDALFDALVARYGGGSSSSSSLSVSIPMELRSRPAILHYYPNTREWRTYLPSAITDPMAPVLRSERMLNHLLFDVLCVTLWGEAQKDLLCKEAQEALNFHQSGGPRFDMHKTGVLTIRPYIAGPLTLMHHDTYTLAQFVQTTAMSEIADRVTRRELKGLSPDELVSAPTWSLPSALEKVKRQVFEAAMIMAGAIEDRKRVIWSALSRDAIRTNPSDGGVKTVTSFDFSGMIASHCNKAEVDCPLFSAGNCLPPPMELQSGATRGNDKWVFSLPGASLDKRCLMWSNSILTLRDVLAKHEEAVKVRTGGDDGDKTKSSNKLSAASLRYITSALSGTPRVNPAAIDAWVDSIRYPAFFLDFEACQFALPPFDGSKSYQAIPFQFSMDVFHTDVLTESPTHYDFLYLGEKGCHPFDDPRALFASKLMEAIRTERTKAITRMNLSGGGGAADTVADQAADDAASGRAGKAKRVLLPLTKGTYRSVERKIVVKPGDGTIIAHYATYERTVLKKLATMFPQFQEEISNFVYLDTIDLVRGSLVHPKCQGSVSLKKVVPALLPSAEQYLSFSSPLGAGAAGGSEGSDVDGGDGEAEAQDGNAASALYRLWRQSGLEHQEALASAQQPERPEGMIVELKDLKKKAEMLGWQTVREQLLGYCNADTRFMYRVVQEVVKLGAAAKAQRQACDKDGWTYLSGEVAAVDSKGPLLCAKVKTVAAKGNTPIPAAQAKSTLAAPQVAKSTLAAPQVAKSTLAAPQVAKTASRGLLDEENAQKKPAAKTTSDVTPTVKAAATVRATKTAGKSAPATKKRKAQSATDISTEDLLVQGLRQQKKNETK